MAKIILIEPCNFIDFPTGGILTFAKHLVAVFGNELKLIGISTDNISIGCWTKKTIAGVEYDYFPYLYLPKSSKKPFIPLRLRNYLALRKYRKEILACNMSNVITRSPDSILAIINFNIPNICYCFAGAENPLKISRYKLARSISFLYDRFFLPKLSKVQLILAAADETDISGLVQRSRGHIRREKVIKFPTRVDTSIFRKMDKNICRKSLSIDCNQLIILTVGRLGWFKGWKFMIDSFKLFQINHSNAHLFFIGNGEDFDRINNYISNLNLESYVHLAGFKNPDEISCYLNAADLFIMGSFKEGWSSTLLEAVACGTPACVTNFSSAHEIVEEGINGFVASTRDEIQFMELINKSLLIDREILPRKIDIDKYSVYSLKEDLLKLWPLV
jgi:glycosyltransferase involved in cell wall biosynthesis